MVNFQDSIKVVLRHEGGYAFNPSDPGGETKYGISKAQYPELNIPALTEADAIRIYHKDYWTRFRLDELSNQNIATAVLDAVVHHGQGIRIVQEALNASGQKVAIDNVIGPETIGALNAVNENIFLSNYVKARKSYMASLIEKSPALEQFRKAWYKRADFFLPTGLGKWSLLVLGAVAVGVYYFLNKKKLRIA